MRYDPNRHYAAAARETAELWRTAAGVALALIAGMALYQLCFALLSNALGPAATQAFVDRTTFDSHTPLATLYALFTFGFFAIGLAMVVHGIHRRSPATLFGPWAAVVSDFLRVVIAVSALYLALVILLPQHEEILRNPELPRRTWIALLPVSLAAILVQAGTEELLFRGYLQQQLAARFSDPRIWIVVPSVLFGLLHLAPGSTGENAPLFGLWATVFALAAADLTARTGSIGAAFGFHAANNIAAILILSPQGTGSGLALYHLPMQADDPRIAMMMLPELATIFCGWLLARLVLKV